VLEEKLQILMKQAVNDMAVVAELEHQVMVVQVAAVPVPSYLLPILELMD
jgi:hypothetical protein